MVAQLVEVRREIVHLRLSRCDDLYPGPCCGLVWRGHARLVVGVVLRGKNARDRSRTWDLGRS